MTEAVLSGGMSIFTFMKKGQFLPRVKRVCKCGKPFEVRQARLDAGRGEYCSKACMYKYRVRPSGLTYVITRENPTSFKAGLIPWNKGTKGLTSANSGSIKSGQHLSPNTEFKFGEVKKESIGYQWLHKWVKIHKGKPKTCCVCGTTKNLQWANISREYRRDVNDFQSMCSKCHRAYDINHLGIATKKFNLKHKRK